MSELKKIQETAFELLMNLHPKHIKVLNNQILRPLYKMATELEKLKEEKAMKPIQEKKEELEEIRLLKGFVTNLTKEVQDKEDEINKMRHQLLIKDGLLEKKQNVINTFLNIKKKKEKKTHGS